MGGMCGGEEENQDTNVDLEKKDEDLKKGDKNKKEDKKGEEGKEEEKKKDDKPKEPEAPKIDNAPYSKMKGTANTKAWKNF